MIEIRHVVLRRKVLDDGAVKWRSFGDLEYDSVKELIDVHVTAKTPIIPEVDQSVLVQAVGRGSWEYLHEDVKTKQVLGEGQFGEVHSGELVIDHAHYAVAIKLAKVVKTDKQSEKSKEKIKEMMHEARIMRYFRHPNVIRLYGVAVCKEPLMIIIELVDGGSLTEVLTKTRKGQVSEEEKISNMSLGAAKGLDYIHSQKCIHRDIAARNVLYSSAKVAKISDFGMSRQGDMYEMPKGSRKIPLKWTAPETIAALIYSPKSDVFSFSILLWEIFSDGAEPYEGKTPIEVRRMVSCGERMEQTENCPSDIYELMAKCWDQNPNNRCTMHTVVKQLEAIISNDSEPVQNKGSSDSCDSCQRHKHHSNLNESSKRKKKKKKKKGHHRHKRSSRRTRKDNSKDSKDSKDSSHSKDSKESSDDGVSGGNSLNSSVTQSVRGHLNKRH